MCKTVGFGCVFALDSCAALARFLHTDNVNITCIISCIWIGICIETCGVSIIFLNMLAVAMF